ncbi:MAG: hypothetical protein ACQEQE_04260 [Bacillota bacterium]
MLTISFLITFVLSICNFIFFIYVVMLEKYFIYYIIYSLISYFIIKDIYKKNLSKYNELPLYYYLFLPGLGPVIISIITFSLYYFLRNSSIISDYEKYINLDQSYDKNEDFNYNEEIKTVSIDNMLEYLSFSEKRKAFLFEDDNFDNKKVNILNKGKKDYNSEIQHYSAVSLNSIENKINSELNDLQNKYQEKKSINILEKIIRNYKKYLESNLLDKASIEIFNNEYIKYLKEYKYEFGFNYDNEYELAKAYIRADRFDKAINIIDDLIKLDDKVIKSYILKLKIFYMQNDLKKLRETINILKNEGEINQLSKDSKLYKQIQFWID